MMKLTLKKHLSPKVKSRLKKQLRVRKKVTGSTERPRLSIFRSNANMYAQIIDDTNGVTLVSASSLKTSGKSGRELAKAVGAEVAKAALSKGIKEVVFDRNGFIYHGRVQALAEGAREAGLSF